ncbi:hypothetical protein DFH09DRAFT_1448972 [Mycena vulgaris]|nr:hypothetical protein DFH09DRAFT_1448972 [Mycena vulgaris]
MAPTGEPKESPKPQPMGGNMPMIFLFTTCTLCLLFILWRRASALRSVISHQLKTITHSQTGGAIRLSEDDGPPAREFLEDDYDEDHEGLDMDDGDIPLPGFVEDGDAIAFEATHTAAAGMVWRVLPGLGRTLSGVTSCQWPRLENNENNFTAGTGPPVRVQGIRFLLPVGTPPSPRWRHPPATTWGGRFAFQIGAGVVQSSYFFPAAARETTELDRPCGECV